MEDSDKLQAYLFPCWGFSSSVPKLGPYTHLLSEYSDRLGYAWVVFLAARDRLFKSLPAEDIQSLPIDEKKFLLGSWWKVENHLIEITLMSMASSIDNLIDGIEHLLSFKVAPIEMLSQVKFSTEIHQLRELANVIKHDGGFLYSGGGRAARKLIKRYNYPNVGLPIDSYSLFNLLKKDVNEALFHAWVFGISLLDFATDNNNPWLTLPEESLRAHMRERTLPSIFGEWDAI